MCRLKFHSVYYFGHKNNTDFECENQNTSIQPKTLTSSLKRIFQTKSLQVALRHCDIFCWWCSLSENYENNGQTRDVFR